MIACEGALRTPDADAEDDAVIDGALLFAQKAALDDAARRGLIAVETAEREIAAIDQRLIKIGAHGSAPELEA